MEDHIIRVVVVQVGYYSETIYLIQLVVLQLLLVLVVQLLDGIKVEIQEVILP